MKKILKTKIVNNKKILKKVKDKYLTESVFENKLEKILDKRFSENTQVILSAVFEMLKKNIEDSERRMLAYTELRTGEILEILKDERQINKEKHQENKFEIENVNKFIKSNILPRIEVLEAK
jgi:hypothetical protein